MQVTTTNFTVAEYAEQMGRGDITVNRDYQRTEEVWPVAARSYLIDTMLLGYPIPKLSLYQKTDLKSRKTIKEIVDGQQRSMAILDFYNGDFRITGKSNFAGRNFDKLEDEEKQRFLDYAVTVDLIINATEEDIRQLFRRINSYTGPLNPQEERHATHQGLFKWFIVELTEKYATTLKKIGVFSEKQLSRMADAALFTEMTIGMIDGIETAARKKLDSFYASHESSFQEEKDVRKRMDFAFEKVLQWESLHGGALMKPYNFFSLFLAISHVTEPLEPLEGIYEPMPGGILSNDVVLANLGILASALDKQAENTEDDGLEGEEDQPAQLGQKIFKTFVDACSEATNTEKQRKERFSWFCKALQSPQF